MVKKTKKHSKLLRILAFMSCLILLFGVIITPSLAATVSPDDNLTSYQVAVPGAYFTITYGDRVVSVNVNEVFSSYIVNSTGLNSVDFAYPTRPGLEGVDLDLNCSIVEGFPYDYFAVRVRNLPTSDYFDYNDMTVDFYQSDYTYRSTATGTFYNLEPRLYTSAVGGVDVFATGEYVGGEYNYVGDNQDTYFIYTYLPENYTLNAVYNDYGFGTIQAFDPSVITSLSGDPASPDSFPQYIYCKSYHASFDFDTTTSNSFAFYVPILPVDSVEVNSGQTQPFYLGSTFWRVVRGVYIEFREVEVLPDLDTFFNRFTGIFRIEIYEFPNGTRLTVGALIAVPIAILIGLAIMRKFAGG